MKHCIEVPCQLFEARGEPPLVFETAEEALDDVSLAIDLIAEVAIAASRTTLSTTPLFNSNFGLLKPIIAAANPLVMLSASTGFTTLAAGASAGAGNCLAGAARRRSRGSVNRKSKATRG